MIEHANTHFGNLCIESLAVEYGEEEARANVVDKGVGIFEVLRMLVVLLHDVGTVVVVGNSVAVGIGFVQLDVDGIII